MMWDHLLRVRFAKSNGDKDESGVQRFEMLLNTYASRTNVRQAPLGNRGDVWTILDTLFVIGNMKISTCASITTDTLAKFEDFEERMVHWSATDIETFDLAAQRHCSSNSPVRSFFLLSLILERFECLGFGVVLIGFDSSQRWAGCMTAFASLIRTVMTQISLSTEYQE